jgi:glycosyltransferase involved in cell wall biosynthesis
MACGCPVVAFNSGSIPEIVQTGETGFVVEDTDSMIDAVHAIGEIDRAACREHALSKFSVSAMVDGYEEIYKNMIA